MDILTLSLPPSSGRPEKSQIFLQLLCYLLFFLAIKTIFNLVYTIFFTPLSKIPGPKISRISYFPISSRRLHGKVYQWFWQLHKEYGNVVRVAPDYVLFSSKEAVRQILVIDDLSKSDSIRGIRNERSTATLFSIINKNFHKKQRRLLSPAFSIKNISTLEPLMSSCTKALVEQINSTITTSINDNVTNPIINIYELVRSCTLDIIGETAFGESFHLVEKGTHPLPTKIFIELKRRVMCHTFPYMRPFLKKDSWTYEFVSNIIKERRESNAKGKRRDDLLQILIDGRDKETGNSLTEAEIRDQTMEFLIAGSDTSGYMANMALITLLNHPEKLKKLISELDSIYSEKEDKDDKSRLKRSNTSLIIPKHDSLKNLKYLNSVLKEILRLFPVALGGIMRQTREDTIIDGYLIPKDTIVGASIYQVHRSKEIWGVDAEEFVPERWISGDDDDNKEKDFDSIFEIDSKIPPKKTFGPTSLSKNEHYYYYPFSAGTRNCIGQNFAWMELRLILASLLLNFEFEMIPDQDLDLSHFITPSLTTKKYDIGVKMRNKS